MNELSQLAIIRLDTELENAIGFRDYYLKQQDLILYNVWDQTVDDIITNIIKLAE
jgi:hypothetical protein